MAPMRLKLPLVPLLVSLAGCLGFLLMGFRPTAGRQLFLMAAILIGLGTLLYYFCRTIWKWRTELYPGLAAIGLLVLVPAMGSALAPHLRTLVFNWDLPRYNAAAQWAASQAVLDKEVQLTPPLQYADLGVTIHIRNNHQCGVVVEFDWGHSYPVLHWIRRYAAAPHLQSKEECMDSRYAKNPRTRHWTELRG